MNKKISSLLRHNKIDDRMASSVMNDSSFVKSISRRFLETASILWIDDATIQELQRTQEERIVKVAKLIKKAGDYFSDEKKEQKKK